MAHPSTITSARLHRAAGAGARRGFTLIEAMIASTVLAISVIGIGSVLTSSYAQSAGQEEDYVALSLARQLIEEINARPLALPGSTLSNPGWAAGVRDRRQYDTIDDYDGYTDASNSLTTLAGQSVNVGGGDVFTRTVSITIGVRPNNHTSAPATDFAAIRVTVAAKGRSVTLSEFATKTTFSK